MTDAELLQAFESCAIPLDQWTHRTHVKITYLYLRSHDSYDAALDALIRGIKAYNTANDIPEGPTSGYNHTTTCAFMHLIHTTMQVYGRSHPTTDADSFCDTHPHLLSKHILRLFYSPARRLDPRAKEQFLEPDLAPLPRASRVDRSATSD